MNAFATTEFPRNWDDFAKSDGNNFQSLYARYKSSFGKSFLSVDDESFHFQIFQSRVTQIFDWNKEAHSYTKGITPFSDLSDDERNQFVMPDTAVNKVSHSFYL